MPKAVTLLYHLMPDTNTATNHNKIVCIVPVSYVLYTYTQHSQTAVSIYSREVALKPEGQMRFTIVHVRTIPSPPLPTYTVVNRILRMQKKKISTLTLW